jgi:hypothetical protein
VPASVRGGATIALVMKMSIGNVRALDWRGIAGLLSVVFVVLAGVACGAGRGHDQGDGDLDKYFRRDTATAEAGGVHVYWLGREFTADGLVFRGPYGAEFGAEVEGGIQLTYLAPLEGGGNVSLDLIVRTREAWAVAQDRIREPGLPGVTRRAVTVGGRQGELILVPLGSRPLNTLWLVLDLGDAVVLAQAGAGGPVYPAGPDYSPFINNPDLLVQVIEENLRPDPE